MHTLEVALVYLGIPAVLVGVFIGALVARRARGGRRYRPGRPFVFTPLWLSAAQDEAGLLERSRVGNAPNHPPALGGASVRW